MPAPVSASPRLTQRRTGLLAGIAAYVLWGIFPLYWPLLKPASALEVLAHRFVWSTLFLLVVVALRRGWGEVRQTLADRRTVGLLSAAAVLIAGNWGLFIWAVNAGYVVEASLGYFISPLVSVLFGVAFFRERLRPLQWASLAVAAIGVALLTLDYGRPPWIALGLALSFASYGVLKKRAHATAVSGLLVETAVLFVPAIVVLVVLEATGAAAFGNVSVAHTALIPTAGIVTAIPLLLFAASARRLPLSMVGVLQYIAPTLQLACGLLVFHEPMPGSRWIGFGLVWLSLVLFTVEGLARARRHAAAQKLQPVLA